MRKNLLLALIAIVGLCFTAGASQVSVQTAQTVAMNFFVFKAANSANLNVVANLNYTQTEPDGTVDFYVFDINPAPGFVIVAADDNLQPVIAYSTESNFNSHLSKTGVKDWMAHAAQHIRSSVQQHVQADARIYTEWVSYAIGQNPGGAKSGTAGPLVASKWDQSPNYNALCPFNSTDQQRAVTGCVATTMAQIMRYWQYPLHGQGSYTYDDNPPYFQHTYGTQTADFGAATYNWSAMPLQLTGANTAVATVMYHCGVSVGMDYGDMNEGGSAAAVLESESWGGGPSAESAFKNNFFYDPNTLQGVHQSDYSSAAWLNLLKGEINAGRPIQYEGFDPNAGGHTWVCDGYDANNMVHMNWGWGGADNGYFSVTSLNPATYNFSTDEGALIGIQPIRASVTASVDKPQLCRGETTFLSAEGDANASYSWTPTTGLSCAGCAYTNANPTATTTYTVKIDSAGFTGTSTVTIVVNPAVSVATTVTNATCYGYNNGAVNITTTGGTPSFNYTWSNGLTSAGATGLVAGTYVVTVTDMAGCSATSIQSVTQPAEITVSTSTNNAGCTSATGSAIATVTGGAVGDVTYVWNTGATVSSVSNLAAGDYTLTVTDSRNCTTVSDVVIAQPYQIQVAATATSATRGLNDGTAAVETVSAGIAPYTYTWSNGATVQSVSGLAPGNYTVTVADNSGCYQTATVVVNAATTTGVNSISNALMFSVYPNPAKTEVLVQLGRLNGDASISFTNVLGQTLFTRAITDVQTQVDLSSFSSGVYFVELKQADKRAVKQLVLNK